MIKKLGPCGPLKGTVTVPGDKSISHRAVMLGSLARGDTRIKNFLRGADCLSTIACFRDMGIEIDDDGSAICVHGKGLHGLKAPEGMLDCGNSGTTLRLMTGILSGQDFSSTLTGDESLKSRPMNRVIAPLTLMGAKIESIGGDGKAPLSVMPSSLNGILYYSPVASAQVKSAILLAGLYADGESSVDEPFLSRDHTERMLSSFGADISIEGTRVSVRPAKELYAQDITVPGDISSAAYFIAAALMIPGSDIVIRDVGINPTRAGMLKICEDMGAVIDEENIRSDAGEPMADLHVRASSLHGTDISGDIIPTLIDELPILAVLACSADGTTTISDAAELRVKESDRIDAMTKNLKAMGADITATDDGMIINGGKLLHGASLDPCLDHRVAMSLAIAALTADGESGISDAGCVDISYPSFFEDLKRLCG